jgi:Ca-activated chloride channel homolog
MTFQWPYALLGAPLVLAVLLALFAGSRRARVRLLGQFASSRLLPVLLTSYSPALRRLKHIAVAAGVVLIVVALARPQWGYTWQEQRARGVDVIFVIDTSKSMLTPDVAPNRLERAKLAIYDCVEQMAGDRVGLVAFAGQAFLQCPLTLDYDAFRETLQSIDTKTIARGGTDIAAGLDEAANALENSGNHKVIVLVTDGEDLEGQGINEAKTLAQQRIVIYTVGVGTAQGDLIPVPQEHGGVDYVRDPTTNQLVTSHLDAATLTSIAQAAGGFYQPLGATDEGLTKIYEDGIKKIPQESLTSRLQRLPNEQFQWPLAAALILLAAESLIGTRRPNWRRHPVSAIGLGEPVAIAPAVKEKAKNLPPARGKKPVTPVLVGCLLAALMLAMAARARAADNSSATDSTPAPEAAAAPAENVTATFSAVSAAQRAQELFQHGDFKGAAQAYGQAADEAPQDASLRYNQGASLYRSGDYDQAAAAFTQTLATTDLPLQQHAYYNLGNTQYRLGQAGLQQDPQKAVAAWESAVKDYQSSLELNPSDPDARYNLDLVNKQLDELKKLLQQQQQQQQQNQQQNQQSQQNQSQSGQSQQNQSQQNQSQGQSQQSQSQNGQGQQQNQSQGQSQQSPSQSGQGQQQSQSSGSQGSQNSSAPSQSGQGQSQNGQGQQQNQASSGQGGQNSSSSQQGNQTQGQSAQNQSQNASQNSSAGQNGKQQENQSNGAQNQNQGQTAQQNSGGNGAQPNQAQTGGNQSPGSGQNSSGQQNQSAQASNQNGGQSGQQSPSQASAGANPRQGQGQSGNLSANQPNSGNPQPGSAQPAQAQVAKTGTEPGAQKTGQQGQQATAAAGAAAATGGNQTGAEGTAVTGPGVMTRDDARQILDSLKASEHKLSTSNYDANKAGAQPPPDQPYKDW